MRTALLRLQDRGDDRVVLAQGALELHRFHLAPHLALDAGDVERRPAVGMPAAFNASAFICCSLSRFSFDHVPRCLCEMNRKPPFLAYASSR